VTSTRTFSSDYPGKQTYAGEVGPML
jgi:hypothetical protein